jgi:predicted transcriptional regulator
LGEKYDGRLKSLALVIRALGHETRLRILGLLLKSPKTWTQMQQELLINPKSLRDHLQFLQKQDLVKKSNPTGFEITHVGKLLLEISLNDILAVIELEN